MKLGTYILIDGLAASTGRASPPHSKIGNRQSAIKRGAGLFLWVLFLSMSALASDWTKLEDCTLVTSEYMDGDSFHVKAGNDEYIFRLYFVDAPETDASLNDRILDQAAYFDIPELRLTKIGRKAARMTRQWLNGKFTVYTQWQDAEGASQLPRFFAVIKVGKEDLAEILVEEGLARVYGASANLPDGTSVDTFFSQLRNLENKAKSKKRGVWGSLKNEDSADNKDEAGGGQAAAMTNDTDISFEKQDLVPPRWPNVPTVAFMRAEAFINLERFEEAETEMLKLLKDYPQHEQKPRIEFYLALSLAMQEKFDQAIPLFEQWLAAYPDQPLKNEAEYWLAVTLFYSSSYADALPKFDHYVEAYPDTVYTPEARFRAALCRYAMEDYKGCALELGAWIEKYPDHFFRWEALVTRGDALAAMGVLEQSRDNYLKVTSAAGPFYYLALTQLAKVYNALGTEKDYQDMAAVFAKFIRDNPDSPQVVDAAYQAGVALRHIGRTEDARKLYWSVIERYGNNNRWEGFDTLLQDLEALYPGESEIFLTDIKTRYSEAIQNQRLTLASRLSLAEAKRKKGADRTLAALEYANRFKGDYLAPESLAFLGETFDRAGQGAKARPYFESLLAKFPESQFAALAHAREAEFQRAAGDLTNAFAHADLAINTAADPQLLMEATFIRAHTLQQLKRYEEAAADFNTILANRVSPRELKPEALLGLAGCMEAQGKTRESIPYYQRIYVLYQAYTGAVATAYLKSGEAFEKLKDVQSAANTYKEMLGIEPLANSPEAEKARANLARLES
ncbi:MAG: tetratricopeptide repeat protein [Lentisphaerota bacterium]